MDEQQGSNILPKEGMSRNKKIAIGCGIASLVITCVCVLISFVFYNQILREPENLTVEAEYPSTVQVGDAFELILNVHNTGDTSFTVGDIDLDIAFSDSILDGAIVERMDPPMEKDFSISGMKTFHYNRAIPPGESQKVTFYLRATEVGEFGGSILVYVGNLSHLLDVSITVIPN
ncbi:MAG: hypothetical protein QGM50_11800 [Anaerolineae bacterium]|nr:hypothetical protein [Anaerolineae bacterium]MDK1082165.1 hypothetical protein [Anaerolineae bacterium]MDK1119454.1 hypothetical protein [Anaerolineae bacterium]